MRKVTSLVACSSRGKPASATFAPYSIQDESGAYVTQQRDATFGPLCTGDRKHDHNRPETKSPQWSPS
jgi:hypothetical protein